MGKKICGGMSARMPVYFVSFTTPTISIGVGVPGFVPKPTCRPIGFSPSKNVRAKLSLMTATRNPIGARESRSRSSSVRVRSSVGRNVRPATSGTPRVSK
jgi:hypothetical protein